MSLMKTIKIEKVTLNIGAGKDQTKLEKGLLLLNSIANATPIKTITNKIRERNSTIKFNCKCNTNKNSDKQKNTGMGTKTRLANRMQANTKKRQSHANTSKTA